MKIQSVNYSTNIQAQPSFKMVLTSVPDKDKWQFETLKPAIKRIHPNVNVTLTYGCETGCWAYRLSGGGKFFDYAVKNIDAISLRTMAIELAKLL